jgi:hypothetical protein
MTGAVQPISFLVQSRRIYGSYRKLDTRCFMLSPCLSISWNQSDQPHCLEPPKSCGFGYVSVRGTLAFCMLSSLYIPDIAEPVLRYLTGSSRFHCRLLLLHLRTCQEQTGVCTRILDVLQLWWRTGHIRGRRKTRGGFQVGGSPT